jgi:hypothetical protein
MSFFMRVDGLGHGVGASELDDAVIGGLRRSEGRKYDGSDHEQGRANQAFEHGVLLLLAAAELKPHEPENDEIGARAEMPPRFQFDAARLWSVRGANRTERSPSQLRCFGGQSG